MRTLQQNELAFINGGGCGACDNMNHRFTLTFSQVAAYLSGGIILGALGNLDKMTLPAAGVIVSGISVLLLGGQELDQLYATQNNTTVAA